MQTFGTFADDCARIRQQSPLILSITNYVAMAISANALLAIGASPLMSSAIAEMEELTALSRSLVINIGTLDEPQIAAMRIAAATANSLGKPWVLDPVGAGASRLRTETARELITLHPSVIRGNASEIMCLAGQSIASRGVDSSADSASAIDAAKKLAGESGSVISVSGATDYITDGKQVLSVSNGSPLMPRITAMGCTATAITAAFLAVNADKLAAAANAMALMGLAGEFAASRAEGTGTFLPHFLDFLSGFNPCEIH